MSGRYRPTTIDVEVDVGEVLSQIDVETLGEELRRRKGASEFIGADWLERIRWFLLRGDTASALAMVEAELPCFQAVAARLTGLGGTIQ